ncbi:MAG: cytochrome c oxidase subunit 3 [Planctomycetota bacterium]
MSATAVPEASPESEPDHVPHGDDPHGHDDGHGEWAHHFDSWKQQFDAGKLGMWAFLVQEILFFSGLFVAYAVYRMLHPEVFEEADQFLSTAHGFLNTLVLLFSSLTMAWAVRAAMLGQQKMLVTLVGITIFCAALFLGVKSYEYTEKWHAKLLWGGTYLGRSTGSPASLITVDPVGTPDMDTIIERTTVSLGIMEVSLWGAALVGAGLFVLAKFGTVRTTDLLAGGAIAGLSGLGSLLYFADAVPMPAAAAALLVGTFMVSFTFLCVRAFCSEIATAVVCLVWSGSAIAMILGSWSSLALHDAIHGGHDESHASADHGGEHHADGHADGHHDDHADGHHAEDEHGEVAHAGESHGDGDHAEDAGHAEEAHHDGEHAEGGHEIPEPDKRNLRLGIFFGIYYTMTGLHAIHILAGIAALTWILVRSVLGHFTPDHFGPVDFVGLYWHIVDLVWIYLFPLLYLIG